MTETVALARRYPAARIVFSGGSGSIVASPIKEAEAARTFLAAMGVEGARIELERNSRNTHENAVFTYRDMAPRPGELWLLVTSAIHMPRAVGAFRAAGWTVIPLPVDYRTGAPRAVPADAGLQAGLEALSVAVREWAALAVYRILGRTNALFPAP